MVLLSTDLTFCEWIDLDRENKVRWHPYKQTIPNTNYLSDLYGYESSHIKLFNLCRAVIMTLKYAMHNTFLRYI